MLRASLASAALPVKLVPTPYAPPNLRMNALLKSLIKKSSPPALRCGIAKGQFLYGQDAGSTTPFHGLKGATGMGYDTHTCRSKPVA